MSHESMTSGTVLSPKHLNRALLARQYLLERVPAAVPSVLEQVAGLQSRHDSAYIGLWSRIFDFERDALTSSLEDRTTVQATLMRQTVHVVSEHDFGPMAAGVRQARRDWWLRVSRSRGIDEAGYRSLADKLATMLADGPKNQHELLGAIEDAGYPKHAFEGVVLWIDLIRVPPAGTWDQPQADSFGLGRDWLNERVQPIEDVDESVGLDILVQRYFRAFGPASVSDVASWAGVPTAALELSIARIDLRRFHDEDGGELFDLPFGPLPEPDTPAPVRFLPAWDAIHLVHAKRAAVVSDKHRELVLGTSRPSGVGTFLVDGEVAGLWRFEDGDIHTDPFAALPSSEAEEVEAEGERLAEFHR